MLEASNELRVVRDELENLMDIISTKVSYKVLYFLYLMILSEVYQVTHLPGTIVMRAFSVKLP